MKGIDLGRLTGEHSRDDGMSSPFVHPACPGARVYITHADMVSAKRGGEEFIEAETHVPPENYGYGLARLRCGRPVQAEKGCAGNVVYYGLCNSCSLVEKQNRFDLRQAKKQREQPPPRLAGR